MKPTARSSCWLLTGLLVASPALADDYDFELDVDFGSTSFDGIQRITTTGGTTVNAGTTDTDDLSIVGSWYFGGLSDDEGPRARAGLVDRASSLSFRYTRTDRSDTSFLTSDDPSFPFPPLNSRFDSDGDSFALDFRYVDRDSGWFGEAGAYTSNTTFGGFVSDSIDASARRRLTRPPSSLRAAEPPSVNLPMVRACLRTRPSSCHDQSDLAGLRAYSGR